MNANVNTTAPAQQPEASFTLDFDSDEPLPVCPMRKDGMGDGEICESCQ